MTILTIAAIILSVFLFHLIRSACECMKSANEKKMEFICTFSRYTILLALDQAMDMLYLISGVVYFTSNEKKTYYSNEKKTHSALCLLAIFKRNCVHKFMTFEFTIQYYSPFVFIHRYFNKCKVLTTLILSLFVNICCYIIQ